MQGAYHSVANMRIARLTADEGLAAAHLPALLARYGAMRLRSCSPNADPEPVIMQPSSVIPGISRLVWSR
jgi:hypothetical protein